MDILTKLKCFCRHHCPTGGVDAEGTCEVELGGRCFAAAEEVINPTTGLLEPEYSFGCFSPGDPAFLQCKGHLISHEIPASIECCDTNDFCNENLRPVYKPSNITDHLGPFTPTSDYYILQLLLGAIVALLLITFCVVLYIVCKYRAREKSQKYRNESESNKSFLLNTTTNSTASSSLPPKDPYFLDHSSGSGSGLPLLVQRTIGRQITLRQRIGKGRYGEVYLGDWSGTFVAVKTFHSMEEASWIKEQQIYKLALIKHPNILVSMAWDIRSIDSITQMIIVTDYHPNGSLYDYLQTHTPTESESLRLILSAVSGLCHLHSEVDGKHYKPGIAHRDLKSKNILVKSNGETCIADFGLSVCSLSGEKGVDIIPNPKEGTVRYMAPEILDGSIKQQWFESYKQADVYAFSLILWEVGSRTRPNLSDGEFYECPVYEIPYLNSVQADPSFEEMREVICYKGIRPDIPQSWSKFNFLNILSKLITESWHRNPQVRLPILRMKKKFIELIDLSKAIIEVPPGQNQQETLVQISSI